MTTQSNLPDRMNDFSFSRVGNSDGTGIKPPEGWRAQRKANREGQHDKSAMLDAEMNPDDNADMSDNEYEYWNTISTGDPVTMGEIKYADDGKKYTHTPTRTARRATLAKFAMAPRAIKLLQVPPEATPTAPAARET